ARPAAEPGALSSVDSGARSFIPFEEIGKRRARWEDIADAWSPSSAANGYPTVDLQRHRGETS
ncbi:MAG: hypothetical protein ACXVSA_22830, partial [Solirubrobacteraceae bacterium]